MSPAVRRQGTQYTELYYAVSSFVGVLLPPKKCDQSIFKSWLARLEESSTLPLDLILGSFLYPLAGSRRKNKKIITILLDHAALDARRKHTAIVLAICWFASWQSNFVCRPFDMQLCAFVHARLDKQRLEPSCGNKQSCGIHD